MTAAGLRGCTAGSGLNAIASNSARKAMTTSCTLSIATPEACAYMNRFGSRKAANE